MILRQFLHTDPVGISYLFGCGGKASAAVVDPVGPIQLYLHAAEEARADIPSAPLEAIQIRAANSDLAAAAA
ncbi:hypothetical protein [Beijerinckia indica]|uniref:Uncharacterized protein n=1 Tax=Beijerinckia indica subsp. indica (strain ATCC 9039 / DSM 1715 / NCIMB 8712) TaxID=395963 RepID=B2IJP8_BEII9|nr:hypothetical protein [Beijerinckia indica]ACB94920.1 hypothetical protein Bind_1279 [Beijerinckia indica subsp. indica ATCC 9039]